MRDHWAGDDLRGIFVQVCKRSCTDEYENAQRNQPHHDVTGYNMEAVATFNSVGPFQGTT
jgi:hypothetical protein